VGHGGTLDPAVTGVLPIALGPATRLLPYLQGDKVYRGVVQLGLRTSTDDLEGEVLQRQSLPEGLDSAELEAALNAFRGTIQQVPPQVSAVHVDGVRAYQRARRGETVVLTPRTVTISRLRLLSLALPEGRLELEIACSAGTYIRSLARDLGDALGCGGALASLRRCEALGFGLQHAVSWSALDLDALAAGTPLPPLLDPLQALSHLPTQPLTEAELGDWRCGRQLQASADWPAGSAVVITAPDGALAGMACSTATGTLQPRLVFDAAG